MWFVKINCIMEIVRWGVLLEERCVFFITTLDKIKSFLIDYNYFDRLEIHNIVINKDFILSNNIQYFNTLEEAEKTRVKWMNRFTEVYKNYTGRYMEYNFSLCYME